MGAFKGKGRAPSFVEEFSDIFKTRCNEGVCFI